MKLQCDRYSPERVPIDVDPRITLLGTVDGLDVYLVDGPTVRDLIDVEFALGGNPARYRYIPLDEIWVEDTADLWMTVEHEIYEYRLMLEGLTYDQAHEMASRMESELRQ